MVALLVLASNGSVTFALLLVLLSVTLLSVPLFEAIPSTALLT